MAPRRVLAAALLVATLSQTVSAQAMDMSGLGDPEEPWGDGPISLASVGAPRGARRCSRCTRRVPLHPPHACAPHRKLPPARVSPDARRPRLRLPQVISNIWIGAFALTSLSFAILGLSVAFQWPNPRCLCYRTHYSDLPVSLLSRSCTACCVVALMSTGSRAACRYAGSTGVQQQQQGLCMTTRRNHAPHTQGQARGAARACCSLYTLNVGFLVSRAAPLLRRINQ